MVDTGDAAQRVAVKGEDVAVRRGSGGAEAPGDAEEDFVPVEASPRRSSMPLSTSRPRVWLLSSSRSMSSPFSNAPAIIWPHAQQEVPVFRVVPPPVVIHVQQADHPVVQHQRHADLALRARVSVQPSFVVAQPRIVRAFDDQRRLLGDGHLRAGEEVEVQRLVPVVVQELAIVVGQHTVQRGVAQDEDLAPLASMSSTTRGPTVRASSLRPPAFEPCAQLDKLGERRVAALELVEQACRWPRRPSARRCAGSRGTRRSRRAACRTRR